MKKLAAFLLTMTLVCSAFSFSFAEETQDLTSIFNSIGSFLTGVWNDASNWMEGAWKDSAAWINSAWGDASKWIEQAWGDSSAWVDEIWGDASGWVSDTADMVNAWWADTFNDVTKNNQDVWAWVREKDDQLKALGSELVENAKAAVASVGDSAEEKVKETVFTLLSKLGIQEADSGKVWETICAYAEQNGISPIAAAKLAVPYLLQLCADSAEQANGSVPAVAVAQYLTGIIEKLGISDNTAADEIVSRLNEALADI